MLLPNIQIQLEEELLTVVCDISINNEESTSTHPDDPITYLDRVIDIVKIRSVHVCVLDKEDINITKNFEGRSNLRARLESRLLEELEYANIHDLKSAA